MRVASPRSTVSAPTILDLVPCVQDAGVEDVSPPPTSGTQGCQVWDVVECAQMATCTGCKLVGSTYVCATFDPMTLASDDVISESPIPGLICGDLDSDPAPFPDYPEEEPNREESNDPLP